MNTYLGEHLILEVWIKDGEKFNDKDFVMNALREASKAGNLSVLKEDYYKFEPYGLTAFLLLSESHISVHTWPEYGYAAIDLFTCGGDIRKATDKLLEILEPIKVKTTYIKRGDLATLRTMEQKGRLFL